MPRHEFPHDTLGPSDGEAREWDRLRSENRELRARALHAIELAAESGTTECGCCAASWLDHPPEECP